jgi:hypothetical protein
MQENVSLRYASLEIMEQVTFLINEIQLNFFSEFI